MSVRSRMKRRRSRRQDRRDTRQSGRISRRTTRREVRQGIRQGRAETRAAGGGLGNFFGQTLGGIVGGATKPVLDNAVGGTVELAQGLDAAGVDLTALGVEGIRAATGAGALEAASGGIFGGSTESSADSAADPFGALGGAGALPGAADFLGDNLPGGGARGSQATRPPLGGLPVPLLLGGAAALALLVVLR